MGTAGFRALLSRAVALANAKSAWPRLVQVNENGTLEGLDELEGQVPLKEFDEGSVVLIGELLGLLAVFIGEDLTLRQLDEVWSEATHHELILLTEKNEKTG